MAANMETDRFLGVRWKSAWAALASPWQQASRWFWVRALTPPVPVTLIGVDEVRTQWRVSLAGSISGPLVQGKAVHMAVELPQELVLHRLLVLPRLEERELQRAIHLDAVANNPFPTEDLCWGQRVSNIPSEPRVRVELVLASRRQVGDFLAGRASFLQGAPQAPEVWVASELEPSQYILMRGFGELSRLSRHKRGRALNLVVMATIAVLLGALAVTPTLQLRARAIEAVKAYDDLHARARTAVASREALVRSSERVQQIDGLLRDTPDAAQMLNLLTRVLTDDTSVTALRTKGRKVVLEGQTTNAAELMQLLGKQSGFEEVVAPVPATRPFGSNKDNFKIEFIFDASRAATPEKAKS